MSTCVEQTDFRRKVRGQEEIARFCACRYSFRITALVVCPVEIGMHTTGFLVSFSSAYTHSQWYKCLLVCLADQITVNSSYVVFSGYIPYILQLLLGASSCITRSADLDDKSSKFKTIILHEISYY